MRISWFRPWLLAPLLALTPSAWAQTSVSTPAPSASPTPTATEAAPLDEDALEAEEERREDEERRERRRRRRGGREDVAFGSSVKVASGEVNRDDIVVMGGTAEIDGTQKGDVVVIGGKARISGTVDGDVVVIGGPLELERTASIDGDAVAVGGPLKKEEGATVSGETVSAQGMSFFPKIWPALPWQLGWGSLLWMSVGQWLWDAAVALLLTVLIAAVLPARVEAAAPVLRERALPCLGWGALTWAGTWLLAGILFISCIACILSPLPILFFQVAKYFGMTVLFLVIGQSLGRTGFSKELTLMPALLLGFVVLSLLALVLPLAWWVYELAGAGCAMLTKFGTLRPWFEPRPTPPPATTTTSLPAPEPLV